MKKNVKKIFLGYRDTFFELKICYLAYYDNCKKYQKKQQKFSKKCAKVSMSIFGVRNIRHIIDKNFDLKKTSIFYKNFDFLQKL